MSILRIQIVNQYSNLLFENFHLNLDEVIILFWIIHCSIFQITDCRIPFFSIVRTSPRIKRKPTRYEVSVVTRDEVGAYKPYLWEQSVFDKGPMFREWLLTKIVNGERASYSAPKFARMQERTRSQMLEDIVANLQNHAETGQIPKPYRRGKYETLLWNEWLWNFWKVTRYIQPQLWNSMISECQNHSLKIEFLFEKYTNYSFHQPKSMELIEMSSEINSSIFNGQKKFAI